MEQLKLLFEYTKFHIGLYTGLGAALIAAMGGKDPFLPASFAIPFTITVFFLGVAGLSGGVIASHIPHFDKFVTFSNQPIGFWGWAPLTYNGWARLEHLAFWIAGITAFISFVLIKVM